MASSQARLLKINLSEASKVCGCCLHASRYEVIISAVDHEALKQAAQEILKVHNGIIISTEHVMRLAGFFKQVGAHKLYCTSQKCGVHLADSCSLWKSRTPESSQ